MHFVFINQYYPPDAAPTGIMLVRVVQEIVEAGHQVTVICAKGGYASKGDDDKELKRAEELQQDGVKVVRVGATSFGRGSFIGKLVDYVSFYVGVVLALVGLSHKPDKIVALTTPPYLSILARVFSKRHGCGHSHWVMDLYPDVMVAHGMLKSGSVLHRLLAALARWGFGGQRCSEVISLGPDMAQRVACYLDEGKTSPWIPLWSGSNTSSTVPDEVMSLRESRGWREEDLVLMYSGNMGLGHLFDEVLAVASEEASAEISRAKNTRFAFFGGGKRRAEMEAFVSAHPNASVELHDYVDAQDLNAHLASADVHLVSLRPEWDGTMVPSKLQGVFAARRPVIFIGSENSSIGQWVLESGGGWLIAPTDVDALKLAIGEASEPDECDRRGELAHSFSMEYFSGNINARRVANLLVNGR